MESIMISSIQTPSDYATSRPNTPVSSSDVEIILPTFEDIREINQATIPNNCANKIFTQFLDLKITGLILLISGTSLGILTPTYVRLTLGTPVIYLFPPVMSLLLLYVVIKVLGRMRFIDSTSENPLSPSRNLQIVVSFVFGYLVSIYSQLDYQHMSCNVLDPLKIAMILIAILFCALFLNKSLVKYRKLVIAVLIQGFFIMTKYGMCFQSICRNMEIYMSVDWQKRMIWFTMSSFVYCSLVLTFSLMEEYLILHPMKLFCPSTSIVMKSVSNVVEQNDRPLTVRQDVAGENNMNPIYNDDTPSTPSDILYSRNASTELLATAFDHWNQGPPTNNSNTEDPKHLAFIITFWLKAYLILFLTVTGILHLMGSAILLESTNHSTAADTMHVLSCHFGVETGYTKNHKKLQSSRYCYVNLLRRAVDEVQFVDYKDRMNNMPVNIDTEVASITRTKRSTFEEDFLNIPRRKNRIKSKHYRKYNNAKKTKSPKGLNDNVKFVERNPKKHNLRKKRTSFQTNALGFKIIQPTDSILQGHVITNKLKPNLVGHVILNKTSVNLNGHTITYKQDLFIREHDPQTPKMHRQHRGRPDLRFINDMIDMKPTANTLTTSGEGIITKSRAKRDIEEYMYMMNDVENYLDNNINKRSYVGTTTSSARPTTPDVYDIYENNLKLDMYPSTESTPTAEGELRAQNNPDTNDVVDPKNALPTVEFRENVLKSNLSKSKQQQNYNYPLWGKYGKNRVSHFDDFIKYKQREWDEKIDRTVWEKSSKFDELKSLLGDKVKGEIFEIKPAVVPIINAEPEIKDIREMRSRPRTAMTCGYIPLYGWAIVPLFVIFTVSATRFLIISQSMIFTIAMMIPALPLTEIWWGITSVTSDGGIIFHVNVNIELVCAFLGLPLILVGLVFLYKAYGNQGNFNARPVRLQRNNEENVHSITNMSVLNENIMSV